MVMTAIGNRVVTEDERRRQAGEGAELYRNYQKDAREDYCLYKSWL